MTDEPDMPDAAQLARLPSLDVELDLTKDEKIRATSLIMAIKYHAETIVRDAAMYQQLKMDQVRLEPTQAHKVVAQAIIFESYMRGDYSHLVEQALVDEMRAMEGMDEETEPRDTVSE